MGDHHHLTLLKQRRGEIIPNGALCMRVGHTNGSPSGLVIQKLQSYDFSPKKNLESGYCFSHYFADGLGSPKLMEFHKILQEEV